LQPLEINFARREFIEIDIPRREIMGFAAGGPDFVRMFAFAMLLHNCPLISGIITEISGKKQP
jgi:hypothetical protein